MADKRISAESLIDLAVATLRDEIAPHLPPDKRYTAAMAANALEIARREIVADGEGEQWKLLDQLYDDGEGSLKQLALDIRNGRISDRSHPDIAERLTRLLVAELQIRNPRFLKSRWQP